jgi:hypothetical protein
MSAVLESPSTEMPAPLVFTDSAADKVKQLVDEEGNPELKLRVFVHGARASSTGSPSTRSSTTTTPRCRRTASPC